MSMVSALIVPLIIIFVLAIGIYKGVNCFQAFKEGAADGFLSIMKLIPTYIGLFSAVSVFKESGIIEYIVDMIAPIFKVPEIISETLPLIIMRPVSGSASLALLENIINKNGADTAIATAACLMMGSTETVFYTMSVYTNDTEIKHMPGVLFASLAANAVSCLLAILWVLFV